MESDKPTSLLVLRDLPNAFRTGASRLKRELELPGLTLGEGQTEGCLSSGEQTQAQIKMRTQMRTEMRTKMNQLLEKPSAPPLFSTPPSTLASSHAMTAPALPSPMGASSGNSLLPRFMALKGEILHELKSNVAKLLTLNPSRREAVAQYLDRLSGQPTPSHPVSPSYMALHRWIEGPKSDAQKTALDLYFEEISLLVLGQALLLKSWSDRKVRHWNESDLGKLNWALSTALKPHVPLDRDGWQITRPNLYSWYTLSPMLQQEIFSVIDSWALSQEGPAFLESLLNSAWHSRGSSAGPALFSRSPLNSSSGSPSSSYDVRFFRSIWQNLCASNEPAESSPYSVRRNRVAFSPTLRDGAIVRSAPATLHWIGFEETSFLLFQAELLQLWWAPTAPPLWSVGTGLEAMSREQMQLALGSPKPSLLSRISEMEACELALVLEERARRTHSRSPESQSFRESLESMGDAFKRLKSTGTSLGDLQACVSVSKLRPGGLLLWAREELLSENDGQDMLKFLLERAKMLAEWDFSEIEHSLPSAQRLFPRYFYLFQREPDLEARLSHRPLRISLRGLIRSHIELPTLFDDAFSSLLQSREPRGPWRITRLQSQAPQKSWAEKWPSPTQQSTLHSLERLREISLPLAAATTIRLTQVRGTSQRGLTLRPLLEEGKRKLQALPLEARAPQPEGEEDVSELMVLFSQAEWTAPLQAYLESQAVHEWLDHHAERKCERKGDRWILTEQLLRFLPVPRVLLRELGAPCIQQGGISEALDAAPDVGISWEKLIAQLPREPKLILERIQKLGQDELSSTIRARALVRSSQERAQLAAKQKQLLALVNGRGHICWKSLLAILPKGEMISMPFHSKVSMTGSLPPHLPIGRIERIRTPKLGIIMVAENGLHLQIQVESPLLLDMIWDQLNGLMHPTWSELVQSVKVPRRLELAESTANDILRSHGDVSQQLKELHEVLIACLSF